MAELKDPVAKLILRGERCAASLEEIESALESCAADEFTVSELGQLTGMDAPTRRVSPVTCEEGTVFISPLGPQTVEIMASGTRGESKVFNYYKLAEGGWTFFGDSIDMLAKPGAAGERECAGCHVSGAPIMKELRDPWVHWLQPDRHLETLEGDIRVGIQIAAESRFGHWRANGSVKQLLAPVLCTNEFNLAAGDGNRPLSEPEQLQGIPWNLLSYRAVPPAVNEPLPGIEGELETAYRARLTEVNQRIESAPGTAVVDDSNAVVRDLMFPLIHPELAAVDQIHVDLLIARSVVSQRFVDDVTSIDFTRPVFSDRRCALLDHVPDVPAADATPAAIVEAIVSSLNAKKAQAGLEPHEAELLALLEDGSDDATHRQATASRIARFEEQCRSLPVETLVDVAINAASQLRAFARGHAIIENRAQMPVDDIGLDPGARLNPETCRFP